MNIDLDKAWNNLKPELDMEQKRREKKKRRFIIFFWFGIAAIGLGGSGWFIYKINNANKAIAKNEINIADKTMASSNNFNKEKISQRKDNIESKSNATQELNAVVNKQDNLAKNKNSITQSSGNAIHSKDGLALSKTNVTPNIGKIKINRNNITQNLNYLSQNKSNKRQSQTHLTQSQNSVAATNDNNVQSTENTAQPINANAQVINKKQQPVNNNQQANSNVATPLQDAKITALFTTNNKAKTPNKNLSAKKVSYGLQFNLPLVQAYNVLDANSKKNISTAFIPSVWISKSISKKQSLLLFINPYSNYYASNKAIVENTSYNVTTQQATQQQAQQNVYTQVISFNKLIGIETGITLQHQITSKISIGAGFSSFFAQSALLQNKVIKNNKTTTKESIYSTGKNDIEWSYLQQNFILARIELNYKFKKIDAGISFAKPVSNIFHDIEVSKTPINMNVFLKWKIK